MDFENLLREVVLYFQNFDAAKALQLTYYSVALILASIGLWKTIRYAEGKMPERLLEFSTREEGRIVERQLDVLGRIKRVPALPQTNEYFDVNAEIDRAVSYLDKKNPTRAASELEELAGRLEEKVKIAKAQLELTQHQAASVRLFLGTLAQKIPERANQSLPALRRAAALWPNDPEAHKEIGLLEKAAQAYPQARQSFEAYWRAACALDTRKRLDKNLLIIDAHLLTAECFRLEGSPDNDKSELRSALDVAETITDGSMQPPSLKASILEALGTNAYEGRNRAQTDKIEEYMSKSAGEFELVGLPEEAERVRQRKREMLTKVAA